jgi:leucyl/phenylalanyl-tRNA--protein transferase
VNAGLGLQHLTWIDPNDPSIEFPPVSEALKVPDGLLAAGGDLSPERLMTAYRQGIFPWYEEGQPILWWSPDPRAVIPLDALHISRSLQKRLRKNDYRVTFDTVFADVVSACAEPREGSNGTWITTDMQDAYIRLHRLGLAHSVEVWDMENKLIGGMYGVMLEKIFAGESMFSRARDGSKLAMVYIAEWLRMRGVEAIDCQLPNPHLMRMGAVEMPRDEFVARYLAPESVPPERIQLYCSTSSRLNCRASSSSMTGMPSRIG